MEYEQKLRDKSYIVLYCKCGNGVLVKPFSWENKSLKFNLYCDECKKLKEFKYKRKKIKR